MNCRWKKSTAIVALILGSLVTLPALGTSSVASSERDRHTVDALFSDNAIRLRRGVIATEPGDDRDTWSSDTASSRDQIISASTSKEHLRLVQFDGTLKRGWIDQLLETGVRILSYIPNNTFLVRGTAKTLARVASLHRQDTADTDHHVRWTGRLLPIEKIHPVYSESLLNTTGSDLDVEIELIDSKEPDSVELINAAASRISGAPRRFGDFIVLSVKLDSTELLAIAALDDVLFIGPASKFTLQDEASAQIVAGNLIGDRSQPSGPGYLDWLASKGLSATADFVVNISDSGLDRGTALASKLHPDFLDSLQQSRIAYITNYATDSPEDRTGHGTIVASVAAGEGVADRKDAAGFRYGLGVDPTARIGISRIFDSAGSPVRDLSYTNVAAAAYANGARVSNNSWGNISSSYDSAAQEFDSIVRDAQPSVAGNQEMVFVFSAGNGGAGGRVGSPGIAKNVISVAASENYRPTGFDSCNSDGAGGIGPDGADNALDILRYSSGGPTADLRAKPDITAPGTHIYGAASQVSGFFGDGLCPGAGVYQPPDQSLYTWSSGTSLAAPHIAGAASLVRKFFTARNLLGENRPPSPAMTKAFLLNSASYITGENAGGDLPAPRQGWGLVNLSRAFDDASRVLIDQTQIFTESGQKLEIKGKLADGSLPLRVTLAWTDAPGSLIGPSLINDLDLEVSIAGVTVYRGNNFSGATSIDGGQVDRLNNVEAIYIPANAIPGGVSGELTIRVISANIVGDGVPGNGNGFDQDFALVAYNFTTATIPPPPPPPDPVPVITGATFLKKRLTITGHDFTANAQVEINGKVINQEFEFDGATNSLGLKLKARKLNLSVDADNQIVLIEKGQRSQPFNLRL